MFYVIGILSVVSICIGLFFRDIFSEDVANVIFFGGVIIGCLNAVIAFFKK